MGVQNMANSDLINIQGDFESTVEDEVQIVVGEETTYFAEHEYAQRQAEEQTSMLRQEEALESSRLQAGEEASIQAEIEKTRIAEEARIEAVRVEEEAKRLRAEENARFHAE